MFILYGVPIGILVGFLLGGRLEGIGRLQLRWAPAILAGLLVQVVLFSDAVTAWIGAAGVPIYVASTALVFGAVLRNLDVPGMALVAAGALSNFLAIVSNGGYMPASPAALAALGKAPKVEYSNSALVANPAFGPLTDVFALPAWLPFANIFSIGDVLIGLGVVVIIASAMRRAAPGAGASGNLPPPARASSTQG